MKIVRNLPSQLILAHAPWLLGAGLIVCILGCAFAGLTLLFAGETRGLLTLAAGTAIPAMLFAAMVQRDQIIFDRVSGTVTLQRQTLWRYSRDTLALEDVHGATTQILSDTARPILEVGRPPRPYPLIEAYVSGPGPERAVQTINGWLEAAP